MQIVQSIVKFLSSSVVRICLLLLPLCLGVALLFGREGYIKQAITDSGLYAAIVPTIIDESITATGNEAGKGLLKDPGVQTAVTSAFTPTAVQQYSETVIDAYYSWLSGRSDSLKFSIDTKGALDVLQQNLAQYAQQRAESLPVCTLAQLKEQPTDQTILTAPCVAPGSSPAAIGQTFSKDVVAQADFLRQPAITEQDLPKDTNQPDTSNQTPQYFQFLQKSPWIIGTIAVLAGSIYILLSADRRKACRSIAMTSIGIGVFLLAGCMLYWLISSRIDSLVQGNSQAFQVALVSLIKRIGSDFNRIVAITSSVYIAVGAIVIILMKRLYPPEESSIIVTQNNMQPPQGGTV